MFSGRGLSGWPIIRSEESYRLWSGCDLKTSKMRRLRSTGGFERLKKWMNRHPWFKEKTAMELATLVCTCTKCYPKIRGI